MRIPSSTTSGAGRQTYRPDHRAAFPSLRARIGQLDRQRRGSEGREPAHSRETGPPPGDPESSTTDCPSSRFSKTDRNRELGGVGYGCLFSTDQEAWPGVAEIEGNAFELIDWNEGWFASTSDSSEFQSGRDTCQTWSPHPEESYLDELITLQEGQVGIDGDDAPAPTGSPKMS